MNNRSMTIQDLNLNIPKRALSDSIQEIRELRQALKQARRENERLREELKALDSEEKRYRDLIGSMNDIIFILDTNQRFVDLFGKQFNGKNMAIESYIGRKQKDLFGRKTAKIHEKYNKQALQGESVIYEWQQKELGALKYFQTSLSPIVSSSQKIKGIMGVAREITNQKKLEQQAIQSEKLMALGQMSAMVSHEFRNSLTSLRMILELQIESNNLSSSERKSLNVALNSVNHMETIVSQMLSFSRPRKIVLQSVDLNQLIEETLALLDAQFFRVKVKIQKVLGKNLPKIRLDKQYIKEALMNLLLNALQSFGDKEERKITIITKQQKLKEALRDKIVSTVEQNGDRKGETISDLILNLGTECFLIIVRDTGNGIKLENQHKIFDPFFTTKTSGTGLGMVLVKQIVNNHGGIITFNSQPGKGTMFKIFLPMN